MHCVSSSFVRYKFSSRYEAILIFSIKHRQFKFHSKRLLRKIAKRRMISGYQSFKKIPFDLVTSSEPTTEHRPFEKKELLRMSLKS